MYEQIHTHAHVHMYMHVHMHMDVHIHMHMHRQMRRHMHMHIHLRLVGCSKTGLFSATDTQNPRALSHTPWNILQHTTLYNALQHTKTRCNTL